MKRFIISEYEKKHIRKLYSLNEANDQYEKITKGFFDLVKQKLQGQSSSPASDSTTSSDTSTSSDSSSPETTKSVGAGEYFVHPNAESITLKMRPSAVPLNSDAEKLLKSIFAEAGTPNLEITSTLRTYEDQARANYGNRRVDIQNWYGADVLPYWDKFKSGGMTQQEFADYLKNRDKSRGKLMSNHLSGLAIDIVPYNEKFASTAEKLMKAGNSGIRKVYREPGNNAVHIEFNFPVTNKSGIGNIPSGETKKKSEIKSDKSFSKSGMIVDKKNENSSDYAIVFGGYPSASYGANFMQQQGTNIIKNKNVVYSNFENSLDSVINYIKSIDPKANISSVSGFSAGGKNAWDAANKGYKTGLIDPIVPDTAYNILGNNLSGGIPNNIKMISRQNNWGGPYRKHGERLSVIEKNNPEVRREKKHDEMPAQFFKEFSDFV